MTRQRARCFCWTAKTPSTTRRETRRHRRFLKKILDDLRSPLRFLLGHTELAKELTGLTLTLVKLDDGSTGYTLSGAPKGMDQRVRTLALTVDAKGEIHAMRIEEIDGATTEFSFSGMKENVPTKDSDFVFIAPEGV